MPLDLGPTRGGEDKDGEGSATKVLLVAEVLVGRDEEIESSLSRRQQISVLKIRPTFRVGGRNLVVREKRRSGMGVPGSKRMRIGASVQATDSLRASSA